MSISPKQVEEAVAEAFEAKHPKPEVSVIPEFDGKKVDGLEVEVKVEFSTDE